MFCGNCGAKLSSETDAFCPKCGKPVQIRKTTVKPKSKSKTAFDEINEMGIGNILPFSIWMKYHPLKKLWVRWFLFFTLFPLFMVYFSDTYNIQFGNIAFAFGMYFAIIWGYFLFYIVKPEKVDRALAVKIFIFTSTVGIFLTLIGESLPVVSNMIASAENGNIFSSLIGFILGVGIIEEGAKALPLYYLFSYKKNRATISEITFLGCISGFAFGISEAVSYSLSYAFNLTSGNFGIGDYLLAQMVRLITLPLLHAVWAGITAYFIALSCEISRFKRGLLLVGICISALSHGLYDASSYSFFGLVIAVFSILLFITYIQRVDTIREKIKK